MRTHMHIVVDWAGVTTASIAKERLKRIISDDRKAAPTFRWKLVWVPGAWVFPPVRTLQKIHFRWDRRQ